jgi:hypothetical protein
MAVNTSFSNTFDVFFKQSIIENIEVDFGKVRNAKRLVGTLKFKGDSLVANCGFFVNVQ